MVTDTFSSAKRPRNDHRDDVCNHNNISVTTPREGLVLLCRVGIESRYCHPLKFGAHTVLKRTYFDTWRTHLMPPQATHATHLTLLVAHEQRMLHTWRPKRPQARTSWRMSNE